MNRYNLLATEIHLGIPWVSRLDHGRDDKGPEKQKAMKFID
jgi:hypothetical protein